MKKYIIIVWLGIVLLTACSSLKQTRSAASFVDPFICSQGDHGQWHPSALVPFGLVKLGPDTYPASLTGSGDCAHSGYDYSDNHIRGFSHFRRGSSGGTSVSDRAGLLSILPFSRKHDAAWMKSPIVTIDKAKEKAECGYYTTYISDENILVELSATAHTGYHRYTYGRDTKAKIMINGRKGKLTIQKIDNYTLEGCLQCDSTNFYFKMVFNASIINTQTFVSDGTMKMGKSMKSISSGGYLCDFGQLHGRPLEIKVGFSLTSQLEAQKNYTAECANASFSQIRKKGFQAWNDILSRVCVKGNNEESKTIFYTSLYHTCFLPMQFGDWDGTYLGMDGEIHSPSGFTFYGSYAFWDSFRSKYALYSLLIPEIYSDVASSLKAIYSQASSFSPFPDSDHQPHGYMYIAHGKRGNMWSDCRHEHMIMIMMDAYKKGLCKFSLSDVYEYMRREVMLQMPEKYDKIGFIPNRVDQTGDYSWDNWCMAEASKDLGKMDDYTYFMKRADYWKNTFDSSIKYFRARSADGSWLDFPNDPTANNEKYSYEGSEWQFRWNSLHDIPGLIALFGGKDIFLKELNYFFDHWLYTQGNQIDLHVPFLFNIAGQPWKTQEWVHRICCDTIVSRYGTHHFFPKPIVDRVYKATPDGYLLEMDDDYGCMSSWYALSAMGLYQICPGQMDYQLFSPVFNKVILRLHNGKTFKIEARNYADDCFYIQSVLLNGKTYNKTSITYQDIIKGGTLIYVMGKHPKIN